MAFTRKNLLLDKKISIFEAHAVAAMMSLPQIIIRCGLSDNKMKQKRKQIGNCVRDKRKDLSTSRLRNHFKIHRNHGPWTEIIEIKNRFMFLDNSSVVLHKTCLFKNTERGSWLFAMISCGAS